MIGMDPKTGRSVQGLDHLYQSIEKILTTPVGTCLQRRNFGSEIFSLVDGPNNPKTRIKLYAATATALMRWEPRLKLSRVSLSSAPQSNGHQAIDIEGSTTISGDLVATTVRLTAEKNA